MRSRDARFVLGLGVAVALARVPCAVAEPALPMSPTVIEGTTSQGEAVLWSPAPDTLGVLLVLPAQGCGGVIDGAVRGIEALAVRRPAAVSAALLLVGAGDGRYIGAAPHGVRVIFDRGRRTVDRLGLPGLPFLLVWTRGGRLARADWIEPAARDRKWVLLDLERCLTLVEPLAAPRASGCSAPEPAVPPAPRR
jgi:hypothetical protein